MAHNIDKVAVCTAPRSVDYLTDTLDSIRNAGWDRIEIFDDHCGVLGCLNNYLSAVEAGYLLVFQDDIQLTIGCREYIERTAPLHAMCSLYCSRKQIGIDNGVNGWHLIRDIMKGLMHGNLATLLTGDAYDMMKNTLGFFAQWSTNPEDRADVRLSWWADAKRVPVYIHYPSLVRHKGVFSARKNIKPGLCGGRQCGEFWSTIPKTA